MISCDPLVYFHIVQPNEIKILWLICFNYLSLSELREGSMCSTCNHSICWLDLACDSGRCCRCWFCLLSTFLNIIQLSLAQVIDNASANSITKYVDNSTNTIPVCRWWLNNRKLITYCCQNVCVLIAYKIQSTAKMSETSSGGRPTVNKPTVIKVYTCIFVVHMCVMGWLYLYPIPWPKWQDPLVVSQQHQY